MPPEIKRILRELMQFRRRLLFIALAGVGMAAADTLSANLIKYVFDGLQFGNTEQIKQTLAIIVGLAFLKGIFRYVHFFNMNYTAELVSQRLRQKLQMKFMKLNLSFHVNYAAGSGGLISRILYDITIIHHGLRMFADFFREPLLFIGLIGTLFYLNWSLTLGILVILPFILWFLRQLSRSIKKYSERGQEDLEVITGTIKESLDGVRIIQSFNLENEMSRRFGVESDNFLFSRKRIHSLIESSGPVTEFAMTIVVCLILLYMTLEIAQGRATYGDFMSYVAAMLMLSAPIKKLQESYVRIQETAVAARRVFELLDEDSEVPQIAKPVPFPRTWEKIRFDNVSFRYGENWVLRNVSFDIQRGQMVAFVGASGSGKSTLVNLLERFFDPTEGRILVDNVDIKDMSLSDLRSQIAMVSQDVFLFSDTVERNIWAGDFSKTMETVQEAAKRANADAFIQRAPHAYQSRVGDKGNLFSGGEKQRLSIARAFFKDAPVLVLDEATSALDSESEVEVQRGLDQLMEGRTALVIAHRLSTISRADLIYVMKAGNIVESGTHEALLARKSEYFKLHQMQNTTERSLT
ncbi:MAG: ABC transporter ATP-binding protein [Bdellovibrionaceae bacterium]|nr:ABC transporter ATP-binding protein [Pseudobdellovibrionaceae bacterium]